jgi:GNAT superfamily N-acetyltransferase
MNVELPSATPPEIEDISVDMIRHNLDQIPQFVLPAPYTLRWYQPGDEVQWTDIHVEAERYNDITPELFANQFGTDPNLLAERQAYLVADRGRVIGTASAWFGSKQWRKEDGRIHWVAIRPSHQGLGLAKPLLTTVCNRLHELGHRRAYLDTSTVRLPAINLYLKFGFVPLIQSAEDRRAWQLVRWRIDHPALADL